jgi:hypothetical protein
MNLIGRERLWFERHEGDDEEKLREMYWFYLWCKDKEM